MHSVHACTDPVAILWSQQRRIILHQAIEKHLLPSFEGEVIQEMRTKYVHLLYCILLAMLVNVAQCTTLSYACTANSCVRLARVVSCSESLPRCQKCLARHSLLINVRLCSIVTY
jgi:hypothetical protein